MGVPDAVMDAFAALAVQSREAKRRRAARAVKIPYHPVLASLFLGLATLFLIAAGYLAVVSVLMLTDDLVMLLGYLLAPMALTGLGIAIQFMAWSVKYLRRSASS